MDSNVDVILYTTGCPRCKILKKKLDDAGVKYKEENNIDTILNIVQKYNLPDEVPLLDISGYSGIEQRSILTFTQAVKWISEIK